MNTIQFLADYVVPAAIASMIIGGLIQITRNVIADARRTRRRVAMCVTHKGRSVIVSRRMNPDDLRKLMTLARQ